jgi:hypothetical protein
LLNVFVSNSGTATDISKIPTDLDSAGQKHSDKIDQKHDALLKIPHSLHCWYLDLGSKFWKTKSGNPN